MCFPRYPVRDLPDKNLDLQKRRIVSAIDLRNKKDDVQEEEGGGEGNEEDIEAVTEAGREERRK